MTPKVMKTHECLSENHTGRTRPTLITLVTTHLTILPTCVFLEFHKRKTCQPDIIGDALEKTAEGKLFC